MSSAEYFVWGGGRWRAVDTASGAVAGWADARFVYARRGRLVAAPRGRVLAALQALRAGAPSAAADGPRLSFKPYKVKRHHRRRTSSCSHCHCCQQRYTHLLQRPSPHSTTEIAIQTSQSLVPAQAPPISSRDAIPQSHQITTEAIIHSSPEQDHEKRKYMSPRKAQGSRTDHVSQKNYHISPRKDQILSRKQYLSPRKAHTSPHKQTSWQTQDTHISPTPEQKSHKKQIHRLLKEIMMDNKEIRSNTQVNGCLASKRARSDSSSSDEELVPSKSRRLSLRRSVRTPRGRPRSSSEEMSQSVLRPRAARQTQAVGDTVDLCHSSANESVACHELIIDDSVVSVLHKYLARSAFARAALRVDAARFASDLAYKTRFFYKINPLVSVERCALAARPAPRSAPSSAPRSAPRSSPRPAPRSSPRPAPRSAPRSSPRPPGPLSMRDFAEKLGLRSVSEASEPLPRYRIRKRNSAPIKISEESSKSASETDIASSHSDDKENFIQKTGKRRKIEAKVGKSDVMRERDAKRRSDVTRDKRERNSGRQDTRDERQDVNDSRDTSEDRESDAPGRNTRNSGRTAHNDSSDMFKDDNDKLEVARRKRGPDRQNKLITSDKQQSTIEARFDRLVNSNEKQVTNKSGLHVNGRQKQSGDKKQVTVIVSSSESDREDPVGSERRNSEASAEGDMTLFESLRREGASDQRRLYSAAEDACIARWLCRGGRARLASGNRVWVRLAARYGALAGRARSWHSLRTRYLRYILPRLPALPLSERDRRALRASHAQGILKSVRAARRNSMFATPVPGAASRRPARAQHDTVRREEDADIVRQIPATRNNPPRYSELTRRFAKRYDDTDSERGGQSDANDVRTQTERKRRSNAHSQERTRRSDTRSQEQESQSDEHSQSDRARSSEAHTQERTRRSDTRGRDKVSQEDLSNSSQSNDTHRKRRQSRASERNAKKQFVKDKTRRLFNPNRVL